MAKIYEYYCEKCDALIEMEFPFAQNPRSVKCECGDDAQRYLGGDFQFILKGSGWPGKTNRLNREMTKRNEDAGSRMRGTWGDSVPKLVDQT